MIKDYYKILGVERHASSEEIRRAFVKLAFRYHPDNNPSPESSKKIKEIIEAYRALINLETRLRYNFLLSQRKALALKIARRIGMGSVINRRTA